ncbi:hypothetical protein ACLBXM_08630 [Xanthobacteraceae bacterium A53D]
MAFDLSDFETATQRYCPNDTPVDGPRQSNQFHTLPSRSRIARVNEQASPRPRCRSAI